MRIFSALDLPLEVKEEIFKKVSKNFRIKGVKLVEKENLHITLKFYGEKSEEEVLEIIDRYESSLAQGLSFEASITKIGAFPNQNNPRVVWLGFDNDKPFQTILNNINEYEKGFVPHLTIARVKDPMAKKEVKEILRNTRPYIKKIKFETLVLYESKLYPTGPVYKPIKKWKL